MSLNISESLLRVSEKVTMTVDLKKLGKVQRNKLDRFIRTGRITGNGVPAQIAVSLLARMGGSYIRTDGAYSSHQSWLNITDEVTQQKFKAYAVLLKMDKEVSRYTWMTQEVDKLAAGNPTGSAYTGYSSDKSIRFVDFIKDIPAIVQPQSVNTLADDIKSGAVTTIDIDLFKGE